MKRLVRTALILAPVVIVLAAALAWHYYSTASKNKAALQEGVVYAIWVLEAEVAPKRENGEPWDSGSDAPDLVAMISWQDQRILETVTVQDSLIARWEPTAVRLGQLMEGEISGSSLRRVALVRASQQAKVKVCVFDEDPLGREFVGGVEVPVMALHQGVVSLAAGKQLQHVALVVSPAGGDIQPPSMARIENPLVEGVVWLDASPAEFGSVLDDVAGKTGEVLDGLTQQLGKELQKEAEAAVGATGEVLEKLRDSLFGKEKQ